MTKVLFKGSRYTTMDYGLEVENKKSQNVKGCTGHLISSENE